MWAFEARHGRDRLTCQSRRRVQEMEFSFCQNISKEKCAFERSIAFEWISRKFWFSSHSDGWPRLTELVFYLGFCIFVFDGKHGTFCTCREGSNVTSRVMETGGMRGEGGIFSGRDGKDLHLDQHPSAERHAFSERAALWEVCVWTERTRGAGSSEVWHRWEEDEEEEDVREAKRQWQMEGEGRSTRWGRALETQPPEKQRIMGVQIKLHRKGQSGLDLQETRHMGFSFPHTLN